MGENIFNIFSAMSFCVIPWGIRNVTMRLPCWCRAQHIVCYIIEHESKAHRSIQGKDYRAKPTTQQHIPTRNTTSAKRRRAQASTQTLNSAIADPGL
jgi:hypothetical protein